MGAIDAWSGALDGGATELAWDEPLVYGHDTNDSFQEYGDMAHVDVDGTPWLVIGNGGFGDNPTPPGRLLLIEDPFATFATSGAIRTSDAMEFSETGNTGRLGEAVLGCDVTGGGQWLFAGATGNTGTYNREGRVFGFEPPFTLPGDVDDANVTLRPVERDYTSFGQSVACGDVTGDGTDDLVVTQRGDTASIMVFEGGSSFELSSPSGADDAWLTIDNGTGGSAFGTDIDVSPALDGGPALVVGDSNSSGGAGAVIAWYGLEGGTREYTWSGDADLVLKTSQSDARVGQLHAAHDLTGDAFTDLVIAGANGGTDENGRVFLVPGAPAPGR